MCILQHDKSKLLAFPARRPDRGREAQGGLSRLLRDRSYFCFGANSLVRSRVGGKHEQESSSSQCDHLLRAMG